MKSFQTESAREAQPSPEVKAHVIIPAAPSTPADEATRAHRAFLTKLRHDLRTPINAIIGYSELMMEDAQDRGDENSIPDLQKIQLAGNQLLAVVNDVLANEKIEAGQLDTDLHEFSEKLHHELRTPLNAVIGYSEMMAEDAQARGQTDVLPDLHKINVAGQNFLALVNEVIDFAQGRKDAISADARNWETEAMVEDVVRTIRPLQEDEAEAVAAERGELLIVDDSEANRDVLSHRLTRQGHSVTAAANGRDALDMIRSQKFDLILLDILMPEMNGFQVLQTLKADKEFRDIPVIMISALDELDSIVRCIEMGAEDYLPKPFNPTLLKARIGASLEKKRLRDQQKELFRKFATKEVAEELMATGFTLGGKYVQATAMFSDIRSFTTIAESQSPADTIALLNGYFGHVMTAINNQDGIVNQMVGDGLMAIFGAPLPRADHRERAVRAALMMMELLDEFNREQAAQNKMQIRIGIGIASGEVIAGYTGTEIRATYTCVGDPVNLAARLQDHTKVVGEPILIDETVRQGLSDQIRVVEQGTVQLKGKTHEVPVFSVPVGQRV